MNYRIVPLFLLAMSFLFVDLPDATGAQAGKEQSGVTIRAGKHKNYIRLVFETEGPVTEQASVVLGERNEIKVSFQSPIAFRLSGSKEPLALKKKIVINDVSNVVVQESSCVVTVNKLDDIKVSKLQGPARLIVDAFINESETEHAPEKKSDNAAKKPEISQKKPDNVTKKPDIASKKTDNATKKTDNASLPAKTAKGALSDTPPASGAVLIDAGHGGQDNGIRSGNFAEKDMALGIAKELGSALAKGGRKVLFTRQSDQGLSISQRIKVLRRTSPEMLLSIHISAKDEFVIYTSPSKTQASGREAAIVKALVQKLKDEFKLNVRHEKLPLPLLSATSMPALLIEFPGPEKFKYERNSKKKLAELISGAITSATPETAAPKGTANEK